MYNAFSRQAPISLLVLTPGRIEEFLLGRGRAVVSTEELEVLVLDGADRFVSPAPVAIG